MTPDEETFKRLLLEIFLNGVRGDDLCDMIKSVIPRNFFVDPDYQGSNDMHDKIRLALEFFGVKVPNIKDHPMAGSRFGRRLIAAIWSKGQDMIMCEEMLAEWNDLIDAGIEQNRQADENRRSTVGSSSMSHVQDAPHPVG